jgi:hypothetical protein
MIAAELVFNRNQHARGWYECHCTENKDDIGSLVDRLLSTSSYKARAEAFANKYGSFDPEGVVTQVVNRVEEISEA